MLSFFFLPTFVCLGNSEKLNLKLLQRGRRGGGAHSEGKEKTLRNKEHSESNGSEDKKKKSYKPK